MLALKKVNRKTECCSFTRKNNFIIFTSDNVYISESGKIEEENEVLRKKIEQKELLTRLRSAEIDTK